MGVNCSAKLSHGATWEYVGLAAAILLGSTPEKKWLSNSGKQFYVAHVPGFDGRKCDYRPCAGMPDYIYLMVPLTKGNPVADAIRKSDTDGKPDTRYAMWYGIEGRTLYPRASAAKIALAEALTKFFGGRIDHNDSDAARDKNYPMPKYLADLNNDANFDRLQRALMNLKPLTKKDIERCKKYAAY